MTAPAILQGILTPADPYSSAAPDPSSPVTFSWPAGTLAPTDATMAGGGAPPSTVDFSTVPEGAPASGQSWAEWRAAVNAAGGVAIAWPFQTGGYARYFGRWSAKYPSTVYAAGVNAGAITTAAPTQATTDGQFVYVLAPSDAAADGPATMTLAERAANALFSKGDAAAVALGLPPLSSWETALKWALALVVLAAVSALLVYAGKLRKELA